MEEIALHAEASLEDAQLGKRHRLGSVEWGQEPCADARHKAQRLLGTSGAGIVCTGLAAAVIANGRVSAVCRPQGLSFGGRAGDSRDTEDPNVCSTGAISPAGKHIAHLRDQQSPFDGRELVASGLMRAAPTSTCLAPSSGPSAGSHSTATTAKITSGREMPSMPAASDAVCASISSGSSGATCKNPVLESVSGPTLWRGAQALGPCALQAELAMPVYPGRGYGTVGTWRAHMNIGQSAAAPCQEESPYLRDPYVGLHGAAQAPQRPPVSSPRLSSSCPAATGHSRQQPVQQQQNCKPLLIVQQGPSTASGCSSPRTGAPSCDSLPTLALPPPHARVWQGLNSAAADASRSGLSWTQAYARDRQQLPQPYWQPAASQSQYAVAGGSGSTGYPLVPGATQLDWRSAARESASTGSVAFGSQSGAWPLPPSVGAQPPPKGMADVSANAAAQHWMWLVYRSFMYDGGSDGAADIAAVTAREGAGSWVVNTLVESEDVERMKRWLKSRIR